MRFSRQALVLLDTQLGLITRPQLKQSGHTAKQIDAMLRRGHLEAVHHGTYRRTGGGAPPGQDALAAVLRCRPKARLTGARVLALLNVEGEDPATSPFTVLVPRGRRIRNVDFPVRTDPAFELHRARFGPIPATTPARTLIERAVEVEDEEQLLLDFDRLRWRGRLGRERLETTVRELGAHPGARRWARLLATDASRQESPGERSLAAVLRRLRPPVEWQVHVAPGLRVDALWRDAGVVLEYDGYDTHHDLRDRRADAARRARLEELGYLVVPVTVRDLGDPDALIARLEALRAQRLPGPPSGR